MARRRGSTVFTRVVRPIFFGVVVVWIGISLFANLGRSGGSSTSGEAGTTSGTNAFSFQSLDADYTLTTDASRRSVLRVRETFVADFPDYDQNKGIVRAIPLSYKGVDQRVQVQSVEDGNGQPRQYWLEQQGGFEDVYISDGVTYQHGPTTYVIDYTMHDVASKPLGASGQEFYWDINGTGWAQRFDRVSVTLHLPAGLAGRLDGQTACYQGAQGSRATCTIQKTGNGFQAAADGALGPHENLTIDVGFRAGTFVIPTSWARIAVWILLALAALLLAVAIIVRARQLGPTSGVGTIVAQYEPAPGIGVLEAAELLDRRKEAFPALVTEFVVSRSATLERRGDDDYSLTLKDAASLDDEDSEAAATLFGSLKPGTTVDLDKKDRKLGDRIERLLAGAEKHARDTGLIGRKTTPLSVTVLVLGIVFALLAAVVGGWLYLTHAADGLHVVALVVAGALGVASAVLCVPPERTTVQAMPSLVHLLGIRDYLRLAEADRIRMLQSPEGAELRPVPAESTTAQGVPTSTAGGGAQAGAPAAPGGPGAPAGAQLVHLYERLLPYAILFGIEKEWREVLGEYYATTPTDVTPSLTSLQAGTFGYLFASNSFATTQPATTSGSSWSGSGGSSSFGGFGGGGFSGGGGGGGGGGGI